MSHVDIQHLLTYQGLYIYYTLRRVASDLSDRSSHTTGVSGNPIPGVFRSTQLLLPDEARQFSQASRMVPSSNEEIIHLDCVLVRPCSLGPPAYRTGPSEVNIPALLDLIACDRTTCLRLLRHHFKFSALYSQLPTRPRCFESFCAE